MSKNILMLCDDNSKISIIAQAVLNHYVKNIIVESAAVKKSKPIDKNVKSALVKDGSWRDEYSSKTLNQVQDREYDLVIALSSSAGKFTKEFSDETIVIQIEYDDLETHNSTALDRFIKTIKMELIPITRDILEL